MVLTQLVFRHYKPKRLVYGENIALKPIAHFFLHGGASLTAFPPGGSRRDVVLHVQVFYRKAPQKSSASPPGQISPTVA